MGGTCPRSALDAEPAEALVDASELPALVIEALLSAGPGRMRLRIDLEPQRVACLAVGRAGLVARPVGHDDGDIVIIRMDIGFHGLAPGRRRGTYQEAAPNATLYP